jgi:hypothetical protein
MGPELKYFFELEFILESNLRYEAGEQGALLLEKTRGQKRMPAFFKKHSYFSPHHRESF